MNIIDTFNLEAKHVRSAITAIKSMVVPARRKIIDCLLEWGPMTVTQLHIKVMTPQTECSRHLAYLRTAQIVTFSKDRKYKVYKVDLDRLGQISRICHHLVNWKPANG